MACALFIEEKGLFALTYASFVIALAFFSAECFVYKTVTFRFLAVIMLVTISSLTWMTLHWQLHFAAKAQPKTEL